MTYWDDHGGSGWVIGMMVTMIVLWGSLVALIWVGVRMFAQRTERTGPADRPAARDVLAERLARGDIDVEDYQRRLQALDDKR